MTSDIRWQQRFSNVRQALAELETLCERQALNEQRAIPGIPRGPMGKPTGVQGRGLLSSGAVGLHKPVSVIFLRLENPELDHNNRLVLMAAMDELPLILWDDAHAQLAGKCIREAFSKYFINKQSYDWPKITIPRGSFRSIFFAFSEGAKDE